MTSSELTIAAAVGAAILSPAAGAVSLRSTASADRVRGIAVGSLAVAVAAAAVATSVWAVADGGGIAWAWTAMSTGTGHALIRFDALTAVLLPYALALSLVAALAIPRRDLSAGPARQTLLGTSLTAALLCTSHPAMLVALWVATAVVTWRAVASCPDGRRTARVYGAYALPALALMAAGTWMMSSAPETGAAGVGAWLLTVAIMMRKGIFPFHSWYPALFSGARVSTALMATMPQVAAYTAVRLLVSQRPQVEHQLGVLVAASLLTCVYGAGLAIVQRDVRGLVGTLAMSQSALVMAGLAGSGAGELAGALAVWVSSGVVLTGVALVARSLEARAGHLSIMVPQGRYADAPSLAICFLAFGLAGSGLPGSFSFVADDLIVSGSLDHRLGAGLMVIASTVLSAIALMRGWFRLFGGPPVAGPGHPVLPREYVACGALIAITFALGIFPAPFVRAAQGIAETVAPGRAPRPHFESHPHPGSDHAPEERHSHEPH